jgi:hypothetical protein
LVKLVCASEWYVQAVSITPIAADFGGSAFQVCPAANRIEARNNEPTI